VNPWERRRWIRTAEDPSFTAICVLAAACNWELHPSAAYIILLEINRNIVEYQELPTPQEFSSWCAEELDEDVLAVEAEEILVAYRTGWVHWVEKPLITEGPRGLPLFPRIIWPRILLASFLHITEETLEAVLTCYATSDIRGHYTEPPENGTERRRVPDTRNYYNRICRLETDTNLTHVEAGKVLRTLERLQGYEVLSAAGVPEYI
jgi:hypothetical protein